MPSNLFGSKGPAKPHLVRGGGGVAGEVADLRADVEEAFSDLESNGGYLQTVEWTDPAGADVDAIKTSIASSTSIETYTGAALDGVIGAGAMTPPRNMTITTSLSGDIDAVAVVITGTIVLRDGTSQAQTDTITLTDGGNVTDVGTKAFSTVTQIVVPAQSGVGGTLQFGFGDVIGMPSAMLSRAGLLAPIREVAAGAVVTTGTFVDAATDGPYGTYAPAAAPDGTNDYALTYEVDTSIA